MSDWYNELSLTFESDKITIHDLGYEVMMSWEDSLMSASAAYVTQNGGYIGNRIWYGNIGWLYAFS